VQGGQPRQDPVLADVGVPGPARASPDLLREVISGFAQRMMDADVEVRCNAGYGFAERCDQGWRARSQP